MRSINELNINCDVVKDKITCFISDQIKIAKVNGAVVSVSGGIDSAVTVALTAKAIGVSNVLALTLPERDVTPSEDVEDVISICNMLNLTCERIEITPILHMICKQIPNFNPENKIAFGNLKARVRMMIGYYYANLTNKMVIGTSNKTELYLGYFTKYGDGGVDVMPLGDLHKNQVRQLANHLKLPERIIKKPPSARLWVNQLTENELGLNYDMLDLIVFSFLKGYNSEEIAKELKISVESVDNIIQRIKNNGHKRSLPLILRLSE
ncbi:NAD+ synthase [Candidatus Bathyarchaeota archaeon]|nr:NAD+ synthase [Candidatus Bathyarchaeota archaeon]